MIENNPVCLRMNVLYQSSDATCLFCNALTEILYVMTKTNGHVFANSNYYIPDNLKACKHNLNAAGYVPQGLQTGLNFVIRPYWD